jgi:cysteinyl-tRNA synthetase
MVSIFNTMSMRKERLEPFDPPQVRIFICGPTVYDYSHIGHARIFIVYDVIARYLESKGFRPFVLLNLTDVDAKVFERARREHTDYRDVATKYTGELMKDLKMLNVRSIGTIAMVSDYVTHAKENVKMMLKEGFAYSANGNIYFDVTRSKGYGSLSHQSTDQMLMRRIDLAPNKRNGFDFLVWNGRDNFEEAWESEFGRGVPWWHIQDTSVAMANFGRYDIHGGARELLYPHHEAHLAQMKALMKNDEPVKYWTHTGLVKVEEQKMSKSLGNVIRIRDAIVKYGSDALRLYMLSRHYREDITFNTDELAGYREKVSLIMNALHKNDSANASPSINEFDRAMDDDFDTEAASNALLSLCRDIVDGRITDTHTKDNIERMCTILGLSVHD